MTRATFASALAVAVLAACDRPPTTFDELVQESLSQIDGEIRLEGLRDTVEILRDPWGVPHIYARNTADLFFAQGFVHAQDRLWQMDMYHRAFAGRLSETLGPDELRHDRLARLLMYRGPWDEREYTSYHPEGRLVFQSFADGVNAFIAHAGENLPVEFKLTGLRPLPWTAETSLLRTQTAMPTGDARSELSLAEDVVEYGPDEANRRARPSPYRDLVVPNGVDLAMIPEEASGGLRGMGGATVRPPLLPQYQAWAPPEIADATEPFESARRDSRRISQSSTMRPWICRKGCNACQDALVAMGLHGLTRAEYAAKNGISKRAARDRLDRAKAALRCALPGYGVDGQVSA